MSRYTLVVLLLVCLCGRPASAWQPWADESVSPSTARHLFEQAWRTTHDHFFDPKLKGLPWADLRSHYEARLAAVHTRGQLRSLINDLLGELHTSHTHVYGPDEGMYWILASTFGTGTEHFPSRILTHDKILEHDAGLFTMDVKGQTFIKAMLEGGPADVAGLKVGDRLVKVDGLDPSFEAWQHDTQVPVEYQRHADGPIETTTVLARAVNPQEAFLDATWRSARVIEVGGRRFGYIHVWAFTSPRIVSLFQRALTGPLANCDGLVLDLRDGVGGGNFDFFLPWAKDVPQVTFIGRKGDNTLIPPRAPSHMVVLINDGSRSAKEIYAFAFQHYHQGTLVGSRTAGDVRAATAFYLDDGELLYLAVADVRVDGADLEGGGVSPDVPVDRPIPWSAGQDPPLDKALQTLGTQLP